MPTALCDREQVTALLRAWMAGQNGALDRLMAAVQAELRRLARVHMQGERRDHTLQPTALVNEIYLRLVDLRDIRWQDRAHFFNLVSTLMRRVLVDAARARAAGKRRKSRMCVTFDETRLADPKAAQDFDMLALNEVLTRLAGVDERKARVVELRFFGGLSLDEAALALELSRRTVAREWAMARAWLQRRLEDFGEGARA